MWQQIALNRKESEFWTNQPSTGRIGPPAWQPSWKEHGWKTVWWGRRLRVPSGLHLAGFTRDGRWIYHTSERWIWERLNILGLQRKDQVWQERWIEDRSAYSTIHGKKSVRGFAWPPNSPESCVLPVYAPAQVRFAAYDQKN